MTTVNRSFSFHCKQHANKLIRSIGIAVAISVCVVTLSVNGYLHRFENSALDFLLAWRSAGKANSIFQVLITDKDYSGSELQSTSPIDRAYLARVLDIVRLGKPRTIGIDVDLSEKYSDVLGQAIARAGKDGISVVLALSAHPVVKKFDPKGKSILYEEEGVILTKKASALFAPSGALYGHVLSPVDADSITRQFYPIVLMKALPRSRPVPNFALLLAMSAARPRMNQEAITTIFRNAPLLHDLRVDVGRYTGRAWKPMPIQLHHIDRPQLINYKGGHDVFGSISSGHLISLEQSPAVLQQLLKDKIILIGGIYSAAKDDQYTPKGRMPGVTALANMTLMFIEDSLIHHLSYWEEFLIEIMIGILIGLLYFFLTPLKATLIAVCSALPLAVSASMVVFSNSYHWLNFIPTAAGVIIHGNTAYIEEYFHLKKKVRHLEKKLCDMSRGPETGEMENDENICCISDIVDVSDQPAGENEILHCCDHEADGKGLHQQKGSEKDSVPV